MYEIKSACQVEKRFLMRLTNPGQTHTFFKLIRLTCSYLYCLFFVYHTDS